MDTPNAPLLKRIRYLEGRLLEVRAARYKAENALREIARQRLSSELTDVQRSEESDFEDAYDMCVSAARKAVAANMRIR
jgi:hypothetical protein